MRLCPYNHLIELQFAQQSRPPPWNFLLCMRMHVVHVMHAYARQHWHTVVLHERVRVQLDEGDPQLHKAVHQLREADNQIKHNQEKLETTEQQVQFLQDDAVAAHVELAALKDTQVASDQNAARLQLRVVSEVQRLAAYTDESVKPLAHKYEVEEVRDSIDIIRGELKGDVEATKEQVKFELLHDKSPHVDELRQFIKLQEGNQGRLNERLCLAEEAVKVARMQVRGAVFLAVHGASALWCEGRPRVLAYRLQSGCACVQARGRAVCVPACRQTVLVRRCRVLVCVLSCS